MTEDSSVYEGNHTPCEALRTVGSVLRLMKNCRMKEVGGPRTVLDCSRPTPYQREVCRTDDKSGATTWQRLRMMQNNGAIKTFRLFETLSNQKMATQIELSRAHCMKLSESCARSNHK